MTSGVLVSVPGVCRRRVRLPKRGGPALGDVGWVKRAVVAYERRVRKVIQSGGEAGRRARTGTGKGIAGLNAKEVKAGLVGVLWEAGPREGEEKEDIVRGDKRQAACQTAVRAPQTFW